MLGDAAGAGAPKSRCELRVEAAGCHVRVTRQSWLEQRMKAAEQGGRARRPTEMVRR